MNKQGFPRGNPAEDCQKLQLWWTEEMQKAGFPGEVAVEHLKLDAQQSPSVGFGKQLFESLVLQRQTTMNTYAYHATIPGAPWPLETVVITTESGMITTVIYRTVLKLPSIAEVAFKKYFELGEASVTLRQAAGENEVIIVTTVRTESAFMGHNYSFGLDKALDIIKAIEHGD